MQVQGTPQSGRPAAQLVSLVRSVCRSFPQGPFSTITAAATAGTPRPSFCAPCRDRSIKGASPPAKTPMGLASLLQSHCLHTSPAHPRKPLPATTPAATFSAHHFAARHSARRNLPGPEQRPRRNAGVHDVVAIISCIVPSLALLPRGGMKLSLQMAGGMCIPRKLWPQIYCRATALSIERPHCQIIGVQEHVLPDRKRPAPANSWHI